MHAKLHAFVDLDDDIRAYTDQAGDDRAAFVSVQIEQGDFTLTFPAWGGHEAAVGAIDKVVVALWECRAALAKYLPVATAIAGAGDPRGESPDAPTD